ncbi:hypothetical protein OAS86_06900 [Gammaproteobacteria bacterium]|nr:hypothetical protein [Gammaproteobacteria bacterium]
MQAFKDLSRNQPQRSDFPQQLPEHLTDYGLLDITTGRIHIFREMLESLNTAFSQYDYSVSRALGNLEELEALHRLVVLLEIDTAAV